MADATSTDQHQQLLYFTEQLKIVEARLAADPTNESDVSLANQLKQAITLTSQLLSVQPEGAVPAAAAVSADDRVEVKYSASWFPAFVDAIHDDGSITVRFAGPNTTEVVTPQLLRPLQTPSKCVPVAQLRAGVRVDAKYNVDGKWYPAKLEGPAEGEAEELQLYKVTFEGYGDASVVPYEYLRPATTAVAATEALQLPEQLQILPTDTEAQRNRKKKKIKFLKKSHQDKQVEDDRNEKQSTWQNFQTTFSKKKAKRKGSLSGKLRKDSIFRTAEGVDSRVGVTNSGQGVTPIQARKKHKR